MNHNRALLLAIAINVFKVKVVRELEVELNSTALPGASQAILKVEVDFRTVKCTVTLVNGVVKTHCLKRIAQTGFSSCPIFIGTHRIFGARRKFNFVWETKLLVIRRNELGNFAYLVTNLVGANKQVRIVLRKLAHTEQTVQGTFKFVAVVKTSFCQLKRQIAIRARLAHVHQTRTRAVHRLNCKVFVVDNGRVHIFFVVIPVT